MTEAWVSDAALAQDLTVTKTTVYRWIARTDMPARRVGRPCEFEVTDVDRWVRRAGNDEAAAKVAA